jgi:hypothetical protein
MKKTKLVRAVLCGIILFCMSAQAYAQCKTTDWRTCNPDPTGNTWAWIDPDNMMWSVKVLSAHVIDCFDSSEGRTDCHDVIACCRETRQYTPPDLNSTIRVECGANENTQDATGGECPEG